MSEQIYIEPEWNETEICPNCKEDAYEIVSITPDLEYELETEIRQNIVTKVCAYCGHEEQYSEPEDV